MDLDFPLPGKAGKENQGQERKGGKKYTEGSIEGGRKGKRCASIFYTMGVAPL